MGQGSVEITGIRREGQGKGRTVIFGESEQDEERAYSPENKTKVREEGLLLQVG